MDFRICYEACLATAAVPSLAKCARSELARPAAVYVSLRALEISPQCASILLRTNVPHGMRLWSLRSLAEQARPSWHSPKP